MSLSGQLLRLSRMSILVTSRYTLAASTSTEASSSASNTFGTLNDKTSSKKNDLGRESDQSIMQKKKIQGNRKKSPPKVSISQADGTVNKPVKKKKTGRKKSKSLAAVAKSSMTGVGESYQMANSAANTFGTLSKPRSDVSLGRDDFVQVDQKMQVTQRKLAEGNDPDVHDLTSALSDELDVSQSQMSRDGRQARWYANQCRKLGDEGKLDLCVAMLERRMLKIDKIKPTAYNFDVVLAALARDGCAEKAFELFRLMSSTYALEATNAIISHLINAAANDQAKTAAIQSVDQLLEYCRTTGIALTRLHWIGLLNVYASAQQFDRMIAAYEKMLSLGHQPEVDVFNALLKSCGHDALNGFGRALQVTNLMQRYGVQPDLKTISNWLYICRLCSSADSQLSAEFGRRIVEITSKYTELAHRQSLLVESGQPFYAQQVLDAITQTSTPGLLPDGSPDVSFEQKLLEKSAALYDKSMVDVKVVDADELGPDDDDDWIPVDGITSRTSDGRKVRSFAPHRQQQQQQQHQSGVVDSTTSTSRSTESSTPSVTSVPSTPPDRENMLPSVFGQPNSVAESVLLSHRWHRSATLRFGLVFGQNGPEGLTDVLKRYRIDPDINVITQVGGMMVCTDDAVKKLLSLARKHDLPVDTTFFNTIMKRRVRFEKDYHGALDMLDMMRPNHVQPDAYTISALAPAASTMQQAYELMTLMRNLKIQPNIQIYEALLRAPLSRQNWRWANSILTEMMGDRIFVSFQMKAFVQKFSTKFQQKVQWRLKKDESAGPLTTDEKFERQRADYRLFMKRFNDYAVSMTYTTRKHTGAARGDRHQSQPFSDPKATLNQRKKRAGRSKLLKGAMREVTDEMLREPDEDMN